MTKSIVILGSLDTKGTETEFLRQRVQAEGGSPLVMDTGVLGEASIAADVTRHQVAAAGGSSIAALIDGRDKTHALVTMAQGAAKLLGEMLQRGELGGVLSIGGSRGTALSTRVMQSLPLGVPKVMVSTIASGEYTFGPYVGTKDVMMMHSVTDVQGINTLTRAIFTNAAAAVVGMSRSARPLQTDGKRVFTASMLGVSTALVSQIQKLMEARHSEVIGFHAIGSGGRSMEELIASSDLVQGMFDLTPGEIVQEIAHSSCSAGPERMLAASRRGIPVVASTGGLDFIITGPLEGLPAEYLARKVMQHTPTVSLVRTSIDEMRQAGRIIAERLSQSKGPAAMILPLEAFGWFAREGQPLHDPASDRAFMESFKQHVSARVQVVEMDTHLNDPLVGETAVQLMENMLP